jgi:glycosyltransferase involved in cell wall biosynthesis
MQSPPRITVITPSYNQGNFIERTIRSVVEQKYPNLEYIIVDGGSTDDTLDILKQYESQLTWISEKDEGQADAINKGIRMSTGEVLTYLNSDDLHERNTLWKVSEYFLGNPSVRWLIGRCRIIDENDQEIRKMITRYKNILLSHLSYNMLLITNPISQPATFWRRSVVDEIGLFDVNEHLVLDYEYWLRIGRKYKPSIVNDYLAQFRVHRQSKTRTTFFDNFRQELLVAKKYSSSRVIHALHYVNYISIYASYALSEFFFGRKR